MKNRLTKYSLFFIFLFLAGIYYLNKNLALLFFNFFWQGLIIVSIIKGARAFVKTRKGPYAKGKLISFKRVDDMETNHRYEGIIEFCWPRESDKYQLNRSLVSIEEEKEYKIWVNKQAPEESVVMSKLDTNWYFSMILFSLIFLGLLYVDYILIMKMFR